MRTYVAKRLLLFIPTLLIVSILIFLILRIIPGDPALQILGGEEGLQQFSQEDLTRMRVKLGTDVSIPEQYVRWVWRMLRLDFGKSYFYETPVWNDIRAKFPITLELTIVALLMAYIVAIPIGVVSAIHQDSVHDYLGRIITIAGIAIPNFWLAIMFIFFLSNVFDWLPPLGYVNFWKGPTDNLQQIVFPALALAFTHMAFIARITRSATLEVIREDYIRTARSKGLTEGVVVVRHTLKNALLPVVTIAAYEFGRLMGGTVIIENIFNVPGMGKLLITAVSHRDFPMVQGIVMVIAVIVLVLNVVTDLIYGWLNPRIKYT